MTVRRRTELPPPARRLRAKVAVTAARLLATQPPARIRTVLTAASRAAAPADASQVEAALADVTAVSLVCRGAKGCVPRSLAAALLCRMSGTWPTWCAGVRTVAPFAAHAWLAVGDEMIGEPAPQGYFRPLMTVPPRSASPAAAPAGETSTNVTTAAATAGASVARLAPGNGARTTGPGPPPPGGRGPTGGARGAPPG
ncbi:MAG: lasso peptide biosynthesis B2 protein, partial [Frankia sp.]|nr:lasso peptide biosynthesis B2 protein [Frankia sp.]